MTITGVEGVLRYGYHVAGTLGAWTITRSGGAWSLSASIVTTEPVRIQRPLVFVVQHQHGVWRWPIMGELQITGASLTATLGPMER